MGPDARLQHVVARAGVDGAMTVARVPLRRDAAVTLMAAAALLLWDLSGWDIAVVRWFGAAQGFAWRDAWLTSTLAHQGGRALAWLALAALAFDTLRPLVAGPSRRERARGLSATLACLLLVPALKQLSHSSCPWDLAEFGGVARYVSHWQWGVGDGGPGRCFPSGHAVAAFAFLPGYFVWRVHRPGLARAGLGAVLVAGMLFGAAQLARGAHYPSHTLWSAWLCWLVCVAAFSRGSRPGPRRLGASAAPPRRQSA
ncbi:MAG TPA: phosphatase PAP2 family protein [Albitalea sp.]